MRASPLLIASLTLNLAAVAAVGWKLGHRATARPSSYPAARMSLFATLGQGDARADVVLLGDSLTDWGEWAELLPLAGVTLVNRGIAGDRTDDVLARLDAVAALRPRVVALLVGVNDLLAGRDATTTADGIDRVVAELGRRLPHAAIVVQGLLPVDPRRLDERLDPALLDAVNARLRARHGARYLDLGATLRDGRGLLDPALSPDGLHLAGEGYRRWAAALRPRLEALLAASRE